MHVSLIGAGQGAMVCWRRSPWKGIMRARHDHELPWLAQMERATRVSPRSRLLALWNEALCVAALYSVVASPLRITFPRTRYPGRNTFEGWLDAAFMVSIIIKLRIIHHSGDGAAHSAWY